MRSLVRLFIGAVLLCLAWVVLTSGQASAAQRPTGERPTTAERPTAGQAPADHARTAHRDTGPRRLDAVLGDALARPAGPVARTADTMVRRAGSTPTSWVEPGAEKHSATQPSATKTSASTPAAAAPPARGRSVEAAAAAEAVVVRTVVQLDHQVAPLLAGATTTARSMVDSGLPAIDGVDDVAEGMPLAGGPVVRVTEAVAALVHHLPVVGVPAPIVPLPIGVTPAAVIPTLPAGGASSLAPQQDPAGAGGELRATVGGDRRGWLTQVRSTSAVDGRSARAQSSAAPGGPPEPSGPWAPLDQSPALPGQPSPSGAATQGGADPAAASAPVVLPTPSSSGGGSVDWRVPRNLPAHPGTRPD